MPARPWAVIAGGGTAGHLLPGLAVADELVGRGHEPAAVHFVGSRHGLEARLLAERPYPRTLLPGRGVQRKLAPANVLAVLGLLAAGARALVLLARARPRVVLALGGYASVACSVAAVVLRIPLVVAEQNARAGSANRLVARWARACAVSFEGTDLPHAVVTGNPVRPELLEARGAASRAAARRELGIVDDAVLVAVFSGSLGSARINAAAREAVELLGDRSELHVRHVLGARDWETLGAAPITVVAGGPTYDAVRYEDRMDRLLAAADLAVCRAGGTTVAERAALGVPAILVPLPIATRDHQRANAQALVQAGAALLVDDADLDGRLLARLLGELLDDAPRRTRMAVAARGVGRPDAAAAVADLLEAAAR
jgi:undecaprenyldiphospho-muramoylpentapeptide beta-N-acetylglucosaminyltransferase